MGPDFRANADIVALTYQSQDRAIEQIGKDYADVFADKEQLKELIRANTQDFQLIVIDQVSVSVTLHA